uniref:Pectate lyase superfamily protein domain-containing protein n=1 Tax=Gossypium raimondii TaxID=29730 RepID=A0A0D2PM22_GOSRA|nr:hypothetical protein B456_008G013400 [Gossypium raimondii]
MSLEIPFKLLLPFSSFSFTGVPAGATTAGLGSQHGQLLPYNNQRTSHFFNVKTFGAQADGLTDDTKVLFPSLSFSIQTPAYHLQYLVCYFIFPFIILFNLLHSSFQAFLSAWNKACQATGEVDIMIPKGTYLVGPLKFAGPCENVSKIVVHMKATTNLFKYGDGAGWVEFRWIEGLTLTGGGTFDGQGAKAWPYNSCSTDFNCKLLPTNVKFLAMNRTIVRGITSVNSKFFHMALVECKNFKGSKIKISAPADSPNTDGIHIQRSSGVYFSRSLIGTGDDCISIGQGILKSP